MNNPYVVPILITGSIRGSQFCKRNATEELVEARLKSFKDKVKLKKHSIGFMFAYNEPLSSYKLHHETPVESQIFERLFLEVPLVDCFGDGEFGKTTGQCVRRAKTGRFFRTCAIIKTVTT